jgi:succinoglycan biosynthesis protein ExoO
MNPEVSIIVPAYNSEKYIAQALKSVFNQTFPNFEIILVDDGSTDSTVQIARIFTDIRLKIIKNRQNRGVSNARNCGIKQAKGNWIALLDSDDWYAPERLEKLLKVAWKQNADMVADDLLLIREGEQYPWSTLLKENERQISSIELIDAVKFVIGDRPSAINTRRNWSLGYTKPLIKRKFLIDHNLEYKETINVGEDFILYLECLRHQARFFLISQPYYYYRTRNSSLSARKPTEYLSQSCEIIQRFIKKEKSLQSDSQLLKVMYRNLAILQKRLSYYRAIEGIKQKNPVEIFTQIIVCPYILMYFAYKLITLMESKKSSIVQKAPDMWI